MNDVEFIALPNICAASDDFTAIIMLFEPRNDDGGVQTAGVRQYDFLNVFHDFSFFLSKYTPMGKYLPTSPEILFYVRKHVALRN